MSKTSPRPYSVHKFSRFRNRARRDSVYTNTAIMEYREHSHQALMSKTSLCPYSVHKFSRRRNRARRDSGSYTDAAIMVISGTQSSGSFISKNITLQRLNFEIAGIVQDVILVCDRAWVKFNLGFVDVPIFVLSLLERFW